jgi:hypothetical protein
MKLRVLLLAPGFTAAAIAPGNTATLRFAFQRADNQILLYWFNKQ